MFRTPALRAIRSGFQTQTRVAMSSFVFPPPPTTGVAIEGSSDQFPVHRVYAIGRNYADHVREMGGDPAKGAPIIFTKPADAVMPSGSKIEYPMATNDLHYEVELVVCIGKGGAKIPVDQVNDHIFGYAVGIDLTRRDSQWAMKKAGMPWDIAKAFDKSAPMGAIQPGNSLDETSKIQLKLNGELRQDATLNQMIWTVPELVHHLSNQFILQPGDLVFTGTPAGVGPLVPGDAVVASVDGLPEVTMEMI
eukprot:Nitzschia sp. Nitz4//scaffold173_size47512//25209//25955//NITZ4_007160-RA/size47512-processed-gene-0.27-mRNA-1//1//CDS//3329538808//7351//frame0